MCFENSSYDTSFWDPNFEMTGIIEPPFLKWLKKNALVRCYPVCEILEFFEYVLYQSWITLNGSLFKSEFSSLWWKWSYLSSENKTKKKHWHFFKHLFFIQLVVILSHKESNEFKIMGANWHTNVRWFAILSQKESNGFLIKNSAKIEWSTQFWKHLRNEV